MTNLSITSHLRPDDDTNSTVREMGASCDVGIEPILRIVGRMTAWEFRVNPNSRLHASRAELHHAERDIYYFEPTSIRPSSPRSAGSNRIGARAKAVS